MPFTQFTSLDFDEIKAQIKDFLRANSNFSDFDFEGSNFSVLIDTLAYNTYINAFNANLVVNESYLDSATVRENVVSLARNIGYVPRSKTAATATIRLGDINVGTTNDSTTKFLKLRAGLVCVGNSENTTYRFSIPDDVTSTRVRDIGGTSFAQFDNPITVHEGTFLSRTYRVDTSKKQRYIIDSPGIDSSTLRVFVSSIADTGLGRNYRMIDNILNIDKNSEIFLAQEVQDEKYEILFGDGFFGRKLENASVITARYIVTDGETGNGASNFSFQGSFTKSDGTLFTPSDTVNVTTVTNASNGADVEDLSSIKYFAPRLYSAQYRAVTPRDYEAIIQTIFPRTESVAVIGGEELDPPQFGKVQISIKPKNGTFVSDFDKSQIKNKLKNYAIAGINSEIVDLKVLYVEIDSSIYYNPSQVSSDITLRSQIISALNQYANNVEINKFGGRFKYSKVSTLIDRVDNGITSNITKVIIRRDLKALLNQFGQYELCFGNRININPAGYNIKSTGFTIEGFTETAYITDVPNKNLSGNLDGSNMGTLSVISKNNRNEQRVIVKDAGVVDYMKGEVILNTINITSTVRQNNIIEVQAFPESNDVVGLKDLYLNFDVSSSKINTVTDVIASGEDVSGVVFTRDYYTSSYSNGDLERK
ncbi:MAG: baseplate wedge protein [Gammaproteobacteria bacterium]|nr:baseplate wedge protein [Gammaproteobacteria bacterium]